MKLLLTKAARINYNVGDVVEASPAQASFLISVGAAVPVDTDIKETARAKRETAKKGTKK